MSDVIFKMNKHKFHEIMYAIFGFIISSMIMVLAVVVMYIDAIMSLFFVVIYAAVLSMWYFSMSNIQMMKRLEKE